MREGPGAAVGAVAGVVPVVIGPADKLVSQGIALYANGDLEGAAASWRQALALAPTDERARSYAAWAEFRLRVISQAQSSAPDAGDEPWKREITLPWNPSERSNTQANKRVNARDAEEPVRQFLSRTPTRPNLAPLDVPELSDEQLAHLSNLARAPAPAPAAVVATARILPRPQTGLDYERILGDRRRTISLGVLPVDLDARSAFLLSRVDGSFSVDDLIDISGMDAREAIRLIALLCEQGALRIA